MKDKINHLLSLLIKSNTLWIILRPIAKFGSKITSLRRRHERHVRDMASEFYDMFQNLTVLNGPFKGMRYPSMASVGSTIYPKLLGSYESELHNVFSEFSHNKYSEIIDVGCAEGYYAVGLAMNHIDSKVYAYDINKDARQNCLDMAKLNGVNESLYIRSALTSEGLGAFKFSNKGLIVCDCEGFENELFNASNIENIKNCDLIIELHDFKNIHISTHLKELFNATHTLESIYSIDDVHKTLSYDFPELEQLSLEHKRIILSEKRITIMEWLICRPKSK